MLLPVLKDEQLQARFDSDGYVKFPFLNAEQIKLLADFYETTRAVHDTSSKVRHLHTTTETFDIEVITSVDKFIRQVFSEPTQRFFKNAQANMGSFLIKETGPDTALLPHQDISFVDEPDYCAFNVWVPLQATGKNSGHLKVLRGSHKIKKTLRVTPISPSAYRNVFDKMKPYFTDVFTQPGDCVVINLSVIHGSDINIMANQRVAAIQMMSSANAELYYYFWPESQPNDRIQKYLMAPGDFSYIEQTGKPGKGTFLGYVSYPFDTVDERVFDNWLKQNFKNNWWQKVKGMLTGNGLNS